MAFEQSGFFRGLSTKLYRRLVQQILSEACPTDLFLEGCPMNFEIGYCPMSSKNINLLVLKIVFHTWNMHV